MSSLLERPCPTSHGVLSAVTVALVMTWGPAQVRAQEATTLDLTAPLARELLSCKEIEDDGQRLACFDRVAEPLAQRAEQEETVVRGDGDWDSEELILESAWRVAWNSQGSILTIELRDSLGQLEDIVGNQIGAGEGASEVLKPGTWRLAVRAFGAWEIRIVENATD